MKYSKRTVPPGFNKVVAESLGEVKVSPAYVTMVRKGLRRNDSVLMAIIQTDHNWDKLERERIKRFTF